MQSFGTSPNVVSQSLVINLQSGSIVKTIPEVGGSDEVWFDPGSENYYLAARSDTTNTGTVTPVLGVVVADQLVRDQNLHLDLGAFRCRGQRDAAGVRADRLPGRRYLGPDQSMPGRNKGLHRGL